MVFISLPTSRWEREGSVVGRRIQAGLNSFSPFFIVLCINFQASFTYIVVEGNEHPPKSKSYFISDYHRQFGDYSCSLCLLQNLLSFYYFCAAGHLSFA